MSLHGKLQMMGGLQYIEQSQTGPVNIGPEMLLLEGCLCDVSSFCMTHIQLI